MSGELCTDNRFEVIAAYKKKLIESTNIEASPEEMAVIDNILFRFWQMGWLPPVPHGRLIDVDALNEAMARMVPWAIADPTANAFLDGLSAAYEVIQSAPTIIPAQEGE